MSDNPFKAPSNQGSGNSMMPDRKSLVSHVPIIAILMLVQGVLLLMMSIFSAGYGYFFANLQNFIPEAEQDEVMQELGPMQDYIVVGTIIVAGGILILAMMHFVSAYCGFQYKNRMFPMVTMVLGLSSSLVCYCAPTAIGLCIYGLIVFLRPEVAAAFQMRKDGMTKEEMLENAYKMNG